MNKPYQQSIRSILTIAGQIGLAAVLVAGLNFGLRVLFPPYSSQPGSPAAVTAAPPFTPTFTGPISISDIQTPIQATQRQPGRPEALDAIRKFSQRQDLSDFVYEGRETIKQDPGAPGIPVDTYLVDGAQYSIALATNRVIEYVAAPGAPSGDKTYTPEELKQTAVRLVEAQMPGIRLEDYQFELGNKDDHYFFRWSESAQGPSYMIFVQAGYNRYGQMVSYINVLP